MPKVIKDGDVTVIGVPKKDLDSLIRFIAHSIDANPDRVLELAQSIVRGDLSQQDAVVNDLITLFDVDDWSIVLEGAEALQLCDELAETIYAETKEQFGPVMKQNQERHLRLVKICVDCHKGFIKGKAHDCENR
jgi:3-oxoacyl-ACP reductase-like protein